MVQESIQAIMVWPGEHPCITELLNDRKFLDFAVGLGSAYSGDAVLIRLSDTAGILYNDLAFLSDLKGNHKIGSRLLAGVFYVVGIKDGKLSSLPFAELEAYFERFWEPEHFTKAEVEEACFADLRNDILDLEKTYFQD